jgi:(p)ppGpp synthase/HD superfamily hydrolase
MNLTEHKINKALEFATMAHKGQKRKVGGEDYISHPIAVSMIISEYTNDTDVIVAALLHDVVEDTKYGLEDLSKLFGERVADMVAGVTEDKSIKDFKVRKEDYYNRVIKNSDSVLIAVADKIHNLASMVGAKDSDFNESIATKKEFYKRVIEILPSDHPLREKAEKLL